MTRPPPPPTLSEGLLPPLKLSIIKSSVEATFAAKRMGERKKKGAECAEGDRNATSRAALATRVFPLPAFFLFPTSSAHLRWKEL